MNFLNVGNRETAQHPTFTALRAVSQRFSKLFNSRAPSAFGTTLQELEASEMQNRATASGPAARQNLVATLSNSRISSPASGLAAIFGGGASTAVMGGNQSATPGLIQQQLTGGQPAIGAPKSISQSDTSTVAPAAPPTPYVPSQGNSTDPGVYGTMDYSEAMNLSANEVQANDENARRYQNYLTEFQNWQINGSQGQPPQPPVYETVDQNGFEKWWSDYQQQMADGNYQPPDNSMFLINAPDYGNGYYGNQGTTEVGTLYNPTGPGIGDHGRPVNNTSATNPASGTNS